MNTPSRTKLAIRNMITNVLNQFISIFSNLVLNPIIVARFGSSLNGLIVTMKSISAYIQLVGAGISESTIVSLYKPLNENNHDEISGIYNASSIAFTRAGCLFSFLSLILAFIYPFITKSELSNMLISLIVVIISIAGASEFFVIGKIRTILIAEQKSYIINIAQMLGSILYLLVTILLIYMGMHVLVVLSTATIMYVLRIFLLVSYINKHYSYLNKSIEPQMSAISRRKAATVHQLTGLVVFSSQTIIISSFCGFSEGSVYGAYSLVFTGINMICSNISSALLASFGQIIASGDKKVLHKAFSLYEMLYYIVVFIMYSAAMILIIPFMTLYMGSVQDTNYIRPITAILFWIMGIMNSIRTPGGTLINAIGHYRETQSRAFIEMIICLIGQLLLVHKYGINGVLVGTIIAYLYRTIDVVIYSNHKILLRSVRTTCSNIAINLALCIMLFLVSLNFNVVVRNYIEWTLYALLVTLSSAVIILIGNLPKNKLNYLEVINRIKAQF